MPARVQVDIKEIYALMCPECRDKLRDLVKEKLTDQAVKQALGGEGEAGKEQP